MAGAVEVAVGVMVGVGVEVMVGVTEGSPWRTLVSRAACSESARY